MWTSLIALLLLAAVDPAAAKPQCKLQQDECRVARERCIANSDLVLGCPAGKEKRCLKRAKARCTRDVRRCCRRTPLETCCSAGAFGTTSTTVSGGGGTTTTTSQFGTTTTTLAGIQSCTSSGDCAGFACCNVAKGQCCVLGSGSASCDGATLPPILAGSNGCTSTDGVFFPQTPTECGPTRPATCPIEAVTPVGYQCHICGDGKIMQTLYNTATGQRTPYP